MSIYKVSDIFASAKSSDFPYVYPEHSYSKGDIVRVKVTPEIVEPDEVLIFSNFLNELGATEQVENFGFSTFKGKESGKINPVYFGLDQEDRMCLRIGETNEKFDSVATEIYCEAEYIAPNPKRPDIKKWIYTLNGVEIKLVEAVDKDGKGQGWYFLQLETTDDDIYTFPFLVDRTKNFTPQDISAAYKDGRFHEVLAKFGAGGGSNCWLEANKAFQEHFKANTFPKEGIHILACNGEIKVTEEDASKNITNTFVKGQWRILDTSHPDLIVQYKDSKSKEMVSTTLETATFISFSSAKNKNEAYSFFTTKGLQLFKGVVLIHIQGMNDSRDITHVPKNTLTALPKRILEDVKDIKTNPRMIKSYTNYIQNNECDTIYPQIDAKSLVAKFLNTLGTTEKEDGIDYEDAKNSIQAPPVGKKVETKPQTTDGLVQIVGDNPEDDVLGKF